MHSSTNKIVVRVLAAVCSTLLHSRFVNPNCVIVLAYRNQGLIMAFSLKLVIDQRMLLDRRAIKN